VAVAVVATTWCGGCSYCMVSWLWLWHGCSHGVVSWLLQHGCGGHGMAVAVAATMWCGGCGHCVVSWLWPLHGVLVAAVM